MIMLVPSTKPEIESLIGKDELDVEWARELVKTYLFPGMYPPPRLSDLQVQALQELLESAYPEGFPPEKRDDTGAHLLKRALDGHHYDLFETVLELFGRRLKGHVFAAVRGAVYESGSGFDFGRVADRYESPCRSLQDINLISGTVSTTSSRAFLWKRGLNISRGWNPDKAKNLTQLSVTGSQSKSALMPRTDAPG